MFQFQFQLFQYIWSYSSIWRFRVVHKISTLSLPVWHVMLSSVRITHGIKYVNFIPIRWAFESWALYIFDMKLLYTRCQKDKLYFVNLVNGTFILPAICIDKISHMFVWSNIINELVTSTMMHYQVCKMENNLYNSF